MTPHLRLKLAASWLTLLGGAACSDGTVTTNIEPHPTIIEVAPEFFLSPEHCVAAPGGVRRYLAIMGDVTPPSQGGGGGSAGSGVVTSGGGPGGGGQSAAPKPEFVLPSSDLIPCSRSVAFGAVVPGRSYVAEIRGYDRDDLHVLEPGVPVVLDANDVPVAPRWTTSCAETRAEASITKRMVTCGQLLAGSTPGPTVVEVGVEGALGQVSCGEGDDQVSTFSVRRDGVELGRATCGERVTLSDLTPGEFVELEVQAFAANSAQARLGGLCSTTVVEGVTLAAHCEPFQAEGAIRFDVPTLLKDAGARCDANLRSLLVDLDAGARTLLYTGKTCAGRSQFAELEPGAHTLDATVTVNGADPVVLHCSATVEPGLAATPECDRL